MNCPKCHADNPDTQRFCGECAAPLTAGDDIQASFTKTLETPVEELMSGSLFADRYEIKEELGKGGMGRVYRVEDTKIHEEMALKLIRPEVSTDKTTIERFRNELKIARKITHKNICRMYDFNEVGQTPYITMEYVPGEDLKSLIRREQGVVSEKAVSVAKQICEGLAEAHKLGIVHRDLKPQNIMIDENGQAKIMDFGIARSVEMGGMTQTGVMIGTPDYMSPEQAEGTEADHRSDIYSLGIILYEMVTGGVPFKGDTAFSVALKHKSKLPQSPAKLNPEISEELSRLILICLEKDRERRYPTADALLDDLVNVEEGLPLGTKIQPRKERAASALIKKKFFIPAVVIALALITLLAWQFLPKNEGVATSLGRSIAVLPFTDLSPEGDQEAQCDGIAEVLIVTLSSIQDLYVPSRFSAASFKGKEDNPVAIGKQMNVGTVLLGTLQNVDGQLRVTAQMIDVGDGLTIWSKMFPLSENLFDIQDTIISSVISELELNPTKEEQVKLEKRYTENEEALELYWRGHHSYMEWTLDGYKKAIPLFLEAIEKDPNFALPYLDLASCYSDGSINYEYPPLDEAYEKIRHSINRAIELDDQLGYSYALLCDLKITFEGDISGAETAILRALELDPRSPQVRELYNLFLIYTGRSEESIAEAELLVRMDPMNAQYHWLLGRSYYFSRRFDESIAAYQTGLEFDPDIPNLNQWIQYTYLALGQQDEALRFAQSMGFKSLEMVVKAAMGHHEEVQKFLETKPSRLTPAYIYGALNEKEKLLEYLKEYVKVPSQSARIPYFTDMHFFDSVRSDPRFIEFIEKGRTGRIVN